MTTTCDFLDAVKARFSLPSDYAVAKKLGLTHQAIYKYRNQGTTFDDLTAMKVANVLEMEPAFVVASVHAERARTPEEKTLWASIFQRFNPSDKSAKKPNRSAIAV